MEKKKVKRLKIADDKLTIEYDSKELSDTLPNLASELINSKKSNIVPISGIKHEKLKPKDPSIVDFLRRCDTNKQAIEIIEFYIKRGEISQQKGKELRDKLSNEGLISFGTKKKTGYYEREFEH